MRTRFMAEKPGDILYTLKIEGTAQEFEALRDDIARLSRSMPNRQTMQLEQDLNNLLGQARKVFYPAAYSSLPGMCDCDTPTRGPCKRCSVARPR